MMKNLRTSSLAAFGFAALLLTGACASTSNDDMTAASTADQTIAVDSSETTVANSENVGTNETSVPSLTGGITPSGAPMDVEPGIAAETTLSTTNTSTTQGSMTSSSMVDAQSADDDDDDDTATATRTRMRKD